MSRINSRQELKEYALRALGAPVILINVDDAQLEDRIDDALELFWEYHSDGSELVFLHHQIDATEKQERVIHLPPSVMSVVSVQDGTAGAGGGSTGIANTNLQYQSFITDYMNGKRLMNGGLSTFYVTNVYLQNLNDTFSTPGRKEFSFHRNRLTLMGEWEALEVGHWVAIECWMRVSEDDTSDIYNNRWLKKYVTALFKYQWGQNLTKFANVTLPGQVQVNADAIFSTAQQEIQALQDELHNNYERPPMFFTG